MSTTQPTPEASLDTALVQRAQGGDEAAFGELMRAHYEQVFRLIVGMVRNEQDARELTQDVWVTAWQQLQTFRAEAKLTTWLHTIAVRRAIDHLRKRRRWFDRFLPFASATSEHDVVQFQAVSEPVDPTPHARAELEQHERHARFEQLLAALPPAHRAVLALREVQGLSYDQIAQLLHCPTGTVMSRLFHARRLLARKLKDLPCD